VAGRDDADHDGQDRREHHREEHQAEGHDRAMRDLGTDVECAPALYRWPEVAVHDSGHPVPVPLNDRLVEVKSVFLHPDRLR
jgi:hypothetical protein